MVVLTDIECGYCRKFHSEIAEYNKRGIEVEYMAFPRAGLGSADYRKMVVQDRDLALGIAMTDAKGERTVPMRNCANPVNMQYAAGQRMGLTGTPMILTPDGEMLGGYLPPAALQQRLEKIDSDRAVVTGS